MQFLETDVAVGAHFHQHVFVVAGVEQLEQKVLRGNGHVVVRDGNAAGLDLLRTDRNPCAAVPSFEDRRRKRQIQPEHIGIDGRGRCRAAVDIACIERGCAHLERDVIRILRDARFVGGHPVRQPIQIFRCSAPIGEFITHLDLHIAELHCAGGTDSVGSTVGEVRKRGWIVRAKAHRAFLDAYPIIIGGDEVRICRAQIIPAPGGFRCAIGIEVVVVHPDAGVHIGSGR